MRKGGWALAMVLVALAPAASALIPGVNSAPYGAWAVTTAFQTCGVAAHTFIEFNAADSPVIVAREDCRSRPSFGVVERTGTSWTKTNYPGVEAYPGGMAIDSAGKVHVANAYANCSGTCSYFIADSVWDGQAWTTDNAASLGDTFVDETVDQTAIITWGLDVAVDSHSAEWIA